MNLLLAKLGSTAMPIIPAAAPDETSPGVTMVLIVPLGRRTLTGPGRSVKNMVPSDKNAMSHGLVSPGTKLVVTESAGEFAGGPESGGCGVSWGGGGGGAGSPGGGFAGSQEAPMIAPRHSTASAAPIRRRILMPAPFPRAT